MKSLFCRETRHRITEANINYYAAPFVHPKRKMREHDFIYMLQGEWKIGQNGEVFTLQKDSLLILTADQVHYGAAPCQAGTKTMYFHVSGEAGDRLAEQDDEAGEHCCVIPAFLDASCSRNLKKYFFEVVNAKLSGDSERASVWFDLLLCELASAQRNADTKSIGEKVKHLIHSNPELFLSNCEIADQIGVSVKTVESKFKAAFGTTIHRYMLKFKIDQAISYMDNFPEMQMKEIAYNLGFYDEYHFSKQFKRMMGISPSCYKTGKQEKP